MILEENDAYQVILKTVRQDRQVSACKFRDLVVIGAYLLPSMPAKTMTRLLKNIREVARGQQYYSET